MYDRKKQKKKSFLQYGCIPYVFRKTGMKNGITCRSVLCFSG